MSGYTQSLLLFLTPVLLQAQTGRPINGIRAVTIPSADVTLSFVQPGLLTVIHPKEGDKVCEEQVVVELDTTVEKAQLLSLEAEAKNVTRIDAAEASLSQKRVDLKRLKKAAERNAATDLEVQHAVLDVLIAELSLKLAQFEHEQAQRKYTEAKLALDRMQLKSPIEGIVEKVHFENGESVNAQDEIIRLVRIDPLWIDAQLPVAEATKLKAGQRIGVQSAAEPGTKVVGQVLHVAAVADAASGTLTARIEVPNPDGYPAGAYVWVVPIPASQ